MPKIKPITPKELIRKLEKQGFVLQRTTGSHMIFNKPWFRNSGKCAFGANGAGKTTLVQSVFGLTRERKGQIFFNGADITGLPAYEVVRRGLSLVPEKRELFPKMTVEENLELGGYSKTEETVNVEGILGLFPILQERKGQLAGTLSGGEQQMLAIARALMAKPSLIVLDEPSLGLSPLLVTSVLDAIAKLDREGLSILLVEQNVQHALEMSHRGYIIENAKIDGHGSPLYASRKWIRAISLWK